MKNKFAVELGKLKRGKKEKPSIIKSNSSRENLEKVRAKRWPKKEEKENDNNI